ncbi:MAG: hypothetical protein LQ339_001178 [Xanthoria mediterranea]|nr:MAG: hypothetical protein LQ339_001178 [Xanthoria mediterranea]
MLKVVMTAFVDHWLAALLLALVVFLVKNRFNHGLQRYPGPFLASLTDWWRFFDVLGRRPEVTHIKLHKKHGDVIRLGPNVLSFASPAALRTIYGLNKGFVKSDFYPVQQVLAKGSRLPSLFSTTDENYHAQLRRCISSAFSMTALIQYEPFVDEAMVKFLEQTESLFSSKFAICDFARWLQWYAFDAIGAITYSRRHGFIDNAEDVDGMVSHLGWLFSYVAPNPIIRLLDRLDRNPFSFAVVKFAKARMSERLKMTDVAKQSGKSLDATSTFGRGDLLSMFLKAKEARPDFFHDGRVLTMAVSMAFAGSETTGISLAAVFYYLVQNPECHHKLVRQIDDAARSGLIEERPGGLVSWAESQKLPYLDACIREAFRLHPAPGLLLERIVPPDGADICGEHIPAGTIVGCNAWVIHRRPEVFGDDVETYRPERWLEVSKKKRKEMDGTMLHFGMGSRTCIGKNISLLEMYKLVPSFLRRFEVFLAHPHREWKLHNAWFVRQLDFDVLFKTRDRSVPEY